MIKQVTVIFFSLALAFTDASAQTFKEQFDELNAKKDTASQVKLLYKWEKSDNNDPELYIAYFNYYVQKSMTDVIAVGNKPKGEDVMVILEKDSTKKEPVGYMYGDTHYNAELLKKAFSYIDKGINKNPTRLDMRFGKIYMYWKIEDYEKFTSEIIKTIDYSAIINNKWTWADKQSYEQTQKQFLGDIQTYVLQLYNTENDNLLNNMKRIAEEVLKYYPDHVESLTNISIVYLLKKEYDKALDQLLKAEILAPKDAIVSCNIAQAYKLKGDTVNAIRYYELAIKNGDKETMAFAKKESENLKKK